MTERPANSDANLQRARALRTVKVLAVVAAGIYVAFLLFGVLHR